MIKLIDNKKTKLVDVINELLPDYDTLSIATGYWDILGSKEVINGLLNYKKIRLLIGQEPMNNLLLKKLGINKLPDFPDSYFLEDLQIDHNTEELDQIEKTAHLLTKLINDGVLEVRVFRDPRLHAKAYIFGDYGSDNAIGIVGSSNFTYAGLTSNAELNAVESDYRIVTFNPQSESQEHGHLSWFDELWRSDEAIEWSKEFQKIIEESPVGDKTFGPYDVYMKTLMELYPDEMISPAELSDETQDILYSFQNRNAGILINKLNRMKLAVLSDSVGLGKTITAGAVMKHYLEKKDDKTNILVVSPASLKQQWEDDLGSVLDIEKREGAFDIISQQDVNKIRETIDYYNKSWRKTKNIDLFIVDEAHNLRTPNSKRYQAMLELFQQHPEAHILLITATPINNALLDISNLIQLGGKGKIKSVNVTYRNAPGAKPEWIDFFEAMKRIQVALRRAENEKKDTVELLNFFKPTIHAGLRHYLVRSTRQGVKAEGGIIDKSGIKKEFPVSKVRSIGYQYEEDITNFVYHKIINHQKLYFQGIKINYLNLENLSKITQQTLHPLDFFDISLNDKEAFNKILPDIDGKDFLYCKNAIKSLVPNLLQVIFTLGFTPYRPLVYQHRYYGKTIDGINELTDVPTELKTHLTIHNILQITWLKRLESSPAALLISVENYFNRITLFEKFLNKGYILSLTEAALVEDYYNDGDDIESAFNDYDEYIKEYDKKVEAGEDPELIEKSGVKRRAASPEIFNMDQLHVDLVREKKIVKLLIEILEEVSRLENDTKMKNLYNHITETLEAEKYGKKVVVFSFFADTITHLEENLHKLCPRDSNFSNESAFIIGGSRDVEKLVGRFSPISKKYELKEYEAELNYLFSTDTLSEGQNLQDSAYLINYDLHWNPVRMIQRNGRVNRLGSKFDEILIGNMNPTEELEMYLSLVRRLEQKINTIKNTVGLDQGVLKDEDVNPIEFIEKYYKDGELEIEEDDFLAHTDEHIIALRRFMGESTKEEILRVSNIPLGKWNYLPASSRGTNKALGLIKVSGKMGEQEKVWDDLFFVEVDTNSNAYVVNYLDYSNALDLIKTSSDDNETSYDQINIDKAKVKSRSTAEARRQADNPDENYKLTPQYKKALDILKDFFPINVDFLGIIESGVKTHDIKNKLESILRKVNKEFKTNDGVVFATTITAFEKIFQKIEESADEEKTTENVSPILYYVG